MISCFKSFLQLVLALVISSSMAMAASNPDITIGATTEGPRYIAIGTSATITATLHWPSDVTPVSGTFTWTATPNGLFTPPSSTGSSTSQTQFLGTTAGVKTIKVKWVPSQTGYDTAESTKEVTVVEITSLSVTEALPVGSTGTYAAAKGTGDVLITAILNPSVSASSLPSDFVTWSGGVAGDDQLKRKVTKTVAEFTNVTALVGSSSKDVWIKVYELTALSVTGADRAGSTDCYATTKGTGDVVITAQLTPEAIASELPAGFITWTPTALTGDDQLSRKVTKTTAAITDVTATCGSMSKSAKIIVAELVSLTVTEAQRVGSTTTYAAWLGTGDVLIEATLNPVVEASCLPSNFVAWTGGVVGDSQLKRKVTKTAVGSTPVTAVVGTVSKDVTIKVYDLTALNVTGAQRDGSTDTYVTKKDAGDVVVAAQLNPSAVASDLPTGFITWTPAALTGDDQLSRKVTKTTAATTTVTATYGTNYKSAKIIVGEVVTTVANATRALMETNDFSMTLTPASETWTLHKIEIRRASGTAWFTIVEADRITGFTQRIAGTFKIRSKATVAGLEIMSDEKDLEVTFPTYAQITSDGTNTANFNASWAATVAAATPTGRREEGWWVTIDTATGSYGKTATALGPTVGSSSTGSVDIGPRPADVPANPDPNATGAVYPVASFHTHTPVLYRVAPNPGAFRLTGPSSADNSVDAQDHVPGVVYDYSASRVYLGVTPLHDPAQIYLSLGVDPRTTP